MQKLSQGEMAMLGFLTYEKSETNPKELSERFNLSTARVANTLNSLERKEYITRVHDSFDRKKSYGLYNRKRKRSRDTGRRTIWQIWKKVLRINSYEGESGDDLGELREYLADLTDE